MMKQRPIFSLFAAMCLGVAFGIASDFVAGGVSGGFNEITSALILSPLLVTVGGGWVGEPLNGLFFIGGCLYWPVFGVLAWRWLRTKRTAFIVAIALWTAQGFFELLHRLEISMSV